MAESSDESDFAAPPRIHLLEKGAGRVDARCEDAENGAGSALAETGARHEDAQTADRSAVDEGAAIKHFKIPGDSSKRSKIEHAYVCARAREALVQKRGAQSLGDVSQEIQFLVEQAKPTKRDRLRKRLKQCQQNPKDKRRQKRLFQRLKVEFLKPQGRFLDAEETIDAAFVKSHRLHDASSNVGRSQGRIVPARKQVALVIHQLVTGHLRKWVLYCQKEKPLAVFHGRRFDSATFRLSSPVELPGVGKLRRNQTTRPIHVMVQRRVILNVLPMKGVGKLFEITSKM